MLVVIQDYHFVQNVWKSLKLWCAPSLCRECMSVIWGGSFGITFTPLFEDRGDTCLGPIIGTWPESNDFWKSTERNRAILLLRFFKAMGLMESGPDTLLGFRLQSSFMMPVTDILISGSLPETQQDQDSLLVKRRNDNHSPGPLIRELVPSSHQRSELSNTILCIFSRWDQRIGEGIPIPDSLGEEATFINICISNGSLKWHRVLISTTPSFGDKVICWYTGFTFKSFI